MVLKTDPFSCCPSLPRLQLAKVERDEYAICTSECKKEGICCGIDCGLKLGNLTDSSGKFDSMKAKGVIESRLNGTNYVRAKT